MSKSQLLQTYFAALKNGDVAELRQFIVAHPNAASQTFDYQTVVKIVNDQTPDAPRAEALRELFRQALASVAQKACLVVAGVGGFSTFIAASAARSSTETIFGLSFFVLNLSAAVFYVALAILAKFFPRTAVLSGLILALFFFIGNITRGGNTIGCAHVAVMFVALYRLRQLGA